MHDTTLIEIITGVITVVTIAVVTKYKLDELNEKYKKMTDKLLKEYDNLERKVEQNNSSIIGLETRSKLTITTTEMDQRYVSKELFRQFEKHMDARLDQLESGQEKILAILNKHYGE